MREYETKKHTHTRKKKNGTKKTNVILYCANSHKIKKKPKKKNKKKSKQYYLSRKKVILRNPSASHCVQYIDLERYNPSKDVLFSGSILVFYAKKKKHKTQNKKI